MSRNFALLQKVHAGSLTSAFAFCSPLPHPLLSSTEEGKALARRLGVGFVETSAKTCINVEKAYYTVVRQIRELRGETALKAGKPVGQKKKKGCTIL